MSDRSSVRQHLLKSWRSPEAAFGMASGAFTVSAFNLFRVFTTSKSDWLSLALFIAWAVIGASWVWIGKSRQKVEQMKKEAADGDRRNATYHQGGPVTGALLATVEGAITASGGLAAPIAYAYAVSGAVRSAGGGTSASVGNEPEPEAELEVYTAPVVGYRMWTAAGVYPRLQAYGNYAWRKGKNEAMCLQGIYVSASQAAPVTIHEAPAPSCLCGFHARSSIDDVLGSAYDNYEIVGGVVGWGKVIEGTNGWRSQYAAVAAILERPIFLEDVITTNTPIMGSSLPTRPGWLAEKYGVPLCHSLQELEEETQKLADWMAGQDLSDE